MTPEVKHQMNYLKQEFARYFPNAKKIQVAYEDETIIVTVNKQPKPLVFTFEIGSDDDYYTFNEPTLYGNITIPMHPEFKG